MFLLVLEVFGLFLVELVGVEGLWMMVVGMVLVCLVFEVVGFYLFLGVGSGVISYVGKEGRLGVENGIVRGVVREGLGKEVGVGVLGE